MLVFVLCIRTVNKCNAPMIAPAIVLADELVPHPVLS